MMFGRRLNKLGAALKSRPPQASFNFALANEALDSRITYTGASARMYFDSTGTLQYAPMNLLTYSEDFSNVAWVKNETTVSGTDTIIPSAVSSALHRVQQGSLSFQSGVSITLAGKVKASGYNFILVRVSNSGEGIAFQVNLNVSAGSLASAAAAYGSGASVAGATITASAEGDGWFDFTLTGAISGLTSYVVTVYVYNATGTPTFAGDGTSGVKVKNFQINPGTTAFDYIPTTTAAVYLPRSNAYQDHNPTTLAPLGFLIEEQRTNSIRNNTMQGAVAGTPGTSPTNWSITTTNAELVSSVVGTGIEDGIAYIDVNIAGTVTSSRDFDVRFEAIGQVAAVSGQQWTQYFYLRQVGGSQANIAGIFSQANTYTAALAYVNTPLLLAETVTTATLRTQRRPRTFSLSGGTIAFVAPFIKVTTAASGAVNFTLRIGLPQLELGAFATSPILTTAAAATRLADVASITGTAFSSFWNQTEGTIVASWDLVLPATGANQFVARASNNTYSNSNGLLASTTGFPAFSTASGGVFDGLATAVASMVANTICKSAGAYKANDLAISKDGAAVVTDASATIPSNLTRLDIGVDHTGANRFGSGHIQSLTYYNKRLPNQTLQALTV
jgi:hypothetical protein